MIDNFDKRIKDNKEDEIPKELDLKLESILNDIENEEEISLNDKKKIKNRNYKKIAMAVGLSVVMMSGLGISAVAQTSGRSVKEVVYDILGYDGEKDILSDIYKSQEKDGIGFTVTRAGYMSDRVIVSYTIRSKEYVDILRDDEYSVPFPYPILYLDGETLIGGSGGSGGKEIISDTEVVGTFDLKEENLKKYIADGNKSLTLKVEVYADKDIKKFTTFETEIPLSEELIIKTEKYEINKEIGLTNKYNTAPSKINNITITPIDLVLNTMHKYIKGADEEETLEKIYNNLDEYEISGVGTINKNLSIDYDIWDDKGRILKFVNGGGGYEMNSNYIPNANMEKLYIVPYIIKAFDENYEYYEEKKLNATVKDGILRIEENEDFKFTYEDLEDKTKINVVVNKDYFNDGIYLDIDEMFWDLSNDKKVSEDEVEAMRYKPKSANTGYIEIPKKLEDGEYIFEYDDFKYTNALLDEVVEVDLTK